VPQSRTVVTPVCKHLRMFSTIRIIFTGSLSVTASVNTCMLLLNDRWVCMLITLELLVGIRAEIALRADLVDVLAVNHNEGLLRALFGNSVEQARGFD